MLCFNITFINFVILVFNIHLLFKGFASFDTCRENLRSHKNFIIIIIFQFHKLAITAKIDKVKIGADRHT